MPALVHGDKCVGESGAICRYVDKTFATGTPLVPAASAAAVERFTKLVADVAHDELVNGYFLKTGNASAFGPARAYHTHAQP